MSRRVLRRGTCTAAFFAVPGAPELPKGTAPGDVLTGKVGFADKGGHDFSCVVGPIPKKEEKETGKTPDLPDERPMEEKMEEAVRNLKVEQLQKFGEKCGEDGEDDSKFEDLYVKLSNEYEGHVPLAIAGLQFYDDKKRRDKGLEKVIATAEKVISLINEKDLAAHFGMEYDKEDPKSCDERKKMEEQKAFLIQALTRKARAMAHVEPAGDGFDQALTHLTRWVNIEANNDHAVLSLEKKKRMGHWGLALKLLNALLKNNDEDTKKSIYPMTKEEILAERTKVLHKLEYGHFMKREEGWKSVTSMKDFVLF